MSDVVIRAEGLGKKYVIGHETAERFTTLRDVLANQARRLARSARDMAAGRALIAGDEREEFWALKDVDFEIKRGEVVGIIGRNGAGKSTLLKVLSRITEPTEGRVAIEGRVASLLEVGTGFHPELTGRENIYLNGAILGMTRAEIRRKFDEIVDFAGVEKFLDTPVKRYSSGMKVRLGFSVAAHLEPEILVVDEVLAVGDAEFQKKCLGKMEDVAGQGRTVLFVSHNLGAVRNLCQRGVRLERGNVTMVGPVEEVLEAYTGDTSAGVRGIEERETEGAAFFRAVKVEPEGAETAITNMSPLRVSFRIMQRKRTRELRLSVGICVPNGEMIFATAQSDSGLVLDGKPGEYRRTLRIPPLTFLPKRYELRAYLWSPLEGRQDAVEGIFFNVDASPESPINVAGRYGLVTIPCKWIDETPELYANSANLTVTLDTK